MTLLKTLCIRVCVALGLAVAAVASAGDAVAMDAEELARARCAGCHSLDVPTAGVQTLQQVQESKGPPLHYAGQKYERDWLQNWLQKPQRITPSGGEFWSNAVVVTDEGDEVDESRLAEHPALTASQAAAVGDYLMTLQPFPQRTQGYEYIPGKVNKMLAQKDFRKFKGCAGCHRDAPEFGGVTGPQLYTAMTRLQPGYIASYIADPSVWNARTLMPVRDLNEASVLKLMRYLDQIKE